MKKIFLILGIIIGFAAIFVSFPVSKNDIEIKNENNEIDSNLVMPVNEVLDTDKKIVQNIVTNNEQTIELENNTIDNSQSKAPEKVQEKASDMAQVTKKAQEVTTKSEEKQVKTQTEKATTKKAEETQTQKTTTNKVETEKQVETKKQETIVSNTKEETSKTETPITVENTTKQENTQTNNKNDTTTKNEITSNDSEPVDTIKRISKEELQAEKAKYLKDIQTIKPGLTYKEVKRGQVFWPYRTSEIEIAIGGVSFGIVYYYVDVLVEDNQEKFKYYIDWAGNE